MTKHWHEKHAADMKIADDASKAHGEASARYRKRIANGELNHRGALTEASHKRNVAVSTAQAKFQTTHVPGEVDHAAAKLLLDELAGADREYAKDVAAANSLAGSERSLAASEYRGSGGWMGESL